MGDSSGLHTLNLEEPNKESASFGKFMHLGILIQVVLFSKLIWQGEWFAAGP